MAKMAKKKNSQAEGRFPVQGSGFQNTRTGTENVELKTRNVQGHVELGKEIKPETKKETVLVQEKPLTPEEEERKRKLREVDEAMMKFNMYPVAANEHAKNEALATLKRLYSSGDDKIRQVILYVLHETLAQFSDYRVQKNLEYFRKKFPQNEAAQNRLNVYRAMFNYSNSIEGLMEVVNLLADLGDNDSAKVLTHHFSFACAYDNSEGSRMLRNAIVDALGKTKSAYALKALLSYVKNTENEQLGGRIISSIVEWKEKIGELKIEQKEKDELLKRINDVVMLEREEGHYR